jgi:hypothetical protein
MRHRVAADCFDCRGSRVACKFDKLARYEKTAAACEQALRYKPDLELARNNLHYARKMARASVK